VNIQTVEILLIEDSPGDIRLTVESLKEAKVYNELHIVEDGVAALDYLHQRGEYADATRPDLILLDLNLPKKDGREVLAEVKADPALRHIPIVVLTTSSSEKDVLRSYELRANAYITKPVDLDRFIEIIRQIEGFWLTIAKLPPKDTA
jgi:chemotaxis family two-component system response regulator Rcp1